MTEDAATPAATGAETAPDAGGAPSAADALASDNGGSAPLTGPDGGALPKWMAQLPEATRANFAGRDGFDTPEAMATRLIELEGTVGKNPLVLPDDADDAEAWSKIYDALGRPENADGYELPLPEGMEPDEAQQAYHGRAREAFHKLGITADQARGLAEFQNAEAAAVQQAVAQAAEEQQAELIREWGGQEKFDLRVDGAKTAIRTLWTAAGLDEETVGLALDAIETGGAGFAATVKFGDALASHVLGDAGLPGDGGGLDPFSSPEAARAEIARIRAERHEQKEKHPLENAKHPEHKAAVERYNRLYEVGYPGTVQD